MTESSIIFPNNFWFYSHAIVFRQNPYELFVSVKLEFNFWFIFLELQLLTLGDLQLLTCQKLVIGKIGHGNVENFLRSYWAP